MRKLASFQTLTPRFIFVSRMVPLGDLSDMMRRVLPKKVTLKALPSNLSYESLRLGENPMRGEGFLCLQVSACILSITTTIRTPTLKITEVLSQLSQTFLKNSIALSQ